MKVYALGLLALSSATVVCAQVYPTLSPETPRIQTVVAEPGKRILLTALPETALTVMLEQGQMIDKIVLEGNRSWEVRVSAEANSFQVTPTKGAAPAVLRVSASSKTYEFSLEASVGLQAGYLVRLVSPSPLVASSEGKATEIEGLNRSYKVRGDRTVRPASVRDNGQKTVIVYAPGQALPAVFAIGPSGDEEVVDGYMRDGLFVIDRIHQELVFRIDKEKATARRNKQKDEAR